MINNKKLSGKRQYAITRAGNDRFRCSVRPASAIT